MNTIGHFTKTGDDYVGFIKTLTLDLGAVTISPNAKITAKSPEHRVYCKGAHIGAGWNDMSEAGVEYIRIILDDASLPSPLYASLFFGKDGEAQLVWNRSRRQAA
jgi:uncharacterized protein (DUF736 family)